MAEVRGWNVLHPTPDGQASSHHDTLPFREKLQLEERWPTGWNGCPTGYIGLLPLPELGQKSWGSDPFIVSASLPNPGLPESQTLLTLMAALLGRCREGRGRGAGENCCSGFKAFRRLTDTGLGCQSICLGGALTYMRLNHIDFQFTFPRHLIASWLSELPLCPDLSHSPHPLLTFVSRAQISRDCATS